MEIDVQGRADHRNSIEPATYSSMVVLANASASTQSSFPLGHVCTIPCHRINYKLTKAHGEGLRASQYSQRP